MDVMAGKGTRVWLGRLVVAVTIVVGACSQHRSDDPFASYDPSDPFDDEFFDSSFESTAIDEIYEGSAPSAGWLYDDRAGAEQALTDHADPFWDDDPAADEFGDQSEKSFSQKAQEATLATLSILVGAGMTALPFLIGT